MTVSRRNPLKNLEKTAHDIAEYLEKVTPEEYLAVYTKAKDDYQKKDAWFWTRAFYAYWRTRNPELDETLVKIESAKQENVNAVDDANPGMLSRFWNYLWGTTESQPEKKEVIEPQSEESLYQSAVQQSVIDDTSCILTASEKKQLSFIQITANLLKDGHWEETSFNTNLVRNLVKKLSEYDENIDLDMGSIKLMQDSILMELESALQKEVNDKEKQCKKIQEQASLVQSDIKWLKTSTISDSEEKLKIELLEKKNLELSEKVTILEANLAVANQTLASLSEEREIKKKNPIVISNAKNNNEDFKVKEIEERKKDLAKISINFSSIQNALKDKFEKGYVNEKQAKRLEEDAGEFKEIKEQKNERKEKLSLFFGRNDRLPVQESLIKKVDVNNNDKVQEVKPKPLPEKANHKQPSAAILKLQNKIGVNIILQRTVGAQPRRFEMKKTETPTVNNQDIKPEESLLQRSTIFNSAVSISPQDKTEEEVLTINLKNSG